MTSPVVAVVDDGDGVGVGGGFNDGREERLSRRALGSFLLNNLSLRLRVRVWDVFGGSSTTSIRSKDPLLCCKNSAGMVIILSLSRSLSLLRWRTRRMRFRGGQRGPYKSRFGGKKCLLSKITSQVVQGSHRRRRRRRLIETNKIVWHKISNTKIWKEPKLRKLLNENCFWTTLNIIPKATQERSYEGGCVAWVGVGWACS